MTIAIRDGESIQRLRARRDEGGGVFRIGKGLAVLDPRTAQEVNAASYTDMALPDRLVDLLRGRKSPQVRWKEVRAAWISQLTTLGKPRHVGELADRLDALIDARLDREADLPWAIQEIFTQALIPTIVANLSPRDLAKVLRDQRYKLTRLMRTTPREETLGEKSARRSSRSGPVGWCGGSCACATGAPARASSTSPTRWSTCCRPWAWIGPLSP